MKILLKGFEQQQILKFAKEMHFPALWSRTKILQLSKSYIIMLFTSQGRSVSGKTVPEVLLHKTEGTVFPNMD